MRIPLIALTTALVTGTYTLATAQTTGWQVGPKAGLNLSVLDGQINASGDFKPGLLVGGFARWRPTERFAIQPELVYSQQGTTNTATYLGNKATSHVHLNYINIPLLVKVYLGKLVNVQVGPQLGLLLSGRREGQYGYTSGSNGNHYLTEDVDVSSSYKSDVAVCGGLGIDLPSGLLASVRINYGISNIDNDAKSMATRQALGLGDLHNRTIECSIGYALGGKK